MIDLTKMEERFEILSMLGSVTGNSARILDHKTDKKQKVLVGDRIDVFIVTEVSTAKRSVTMMRPDRTTFTLEKE